MSADVLEQAFASSAKVLAGVQAGDLDKPTPCASWKIRDVVNHMVGGTHYFAETAETGVAPTTPSARLRQRRHQQCLCRGLGPGGRRLPRRGCDGEDDEAALR